MTVSTLKKQIARDITNIIFTRGLTQLQAAIIAGDAPSQISLLTTGKLQQFSMERLLHILASLGATVDIRPKFAPRGRIVRRTVTYKRCTRA